MDNQNQVRKCTKCGAPLTPDSAFCTTCGTPVPKAAPTKPQAPAFEFCVHCGSKYPVGDKFCQNCGKSTAQAPTPVLTKEEMDKREYDSAVKMLEAKHFDQALAIFQKLGDYADSKAKAKECMEAKELARKEFVYGRATSVIVAQSVTDVQIKEAIAALKSIGEFKDAPKKVTEAEARLDKWYKDKAAWEEAERIRKAKAKAKAKKIILICSIAFVALALIVTGIILVTMSHDITYNLDGGTLANPNPDSYTMLTGDIVLNNPTRDGYDFIGWEIDGEVSSNATIPQFSFGDKQITAKWDADDYTITLNANGGVGVDSTFSVEYGSYYELPRPTKTGYTFDGWYRNYKKIAQNGKWDTIENEDEPITFVAQWSPNKYDVTFDDVTTKSSLVVTYNYNYSGSKNSQVTIRNGNTLSYPSIPTRSDYVFTGWYTDSNCTTRYNFTGTITADMTLYAGWTQMSMSSAYTEVQINPSDYTSSSNAYSLSTRYTDSSDKKHIYLVANETGTHKIYYKNSYSSSSYSYYLQVYNLTKGTTIRSNSYVSSTYYDYINFECSAGDVIVISIYKYSTSSSYYSTAYFYFNGFKSTSSATASVSGLVHQAYSTYKLEATYDSTFTLPTPTRPGYRFLGWYMGNTKVESGRWTIAEDNVILTPRWEEIVYYNVTFNNATEAYKTIKVTYNYNYSGLTNSVVELSNGQTLSYPSIPTRSGYIFAGWYTDSSCTNRYSFSGTLTQDITLYAKWVSCTYNTISVGSSASVSLNGTSVRYYAFVPLVSGSITVYSSSNYDTYGYLYDSSFSTLTYNDDGGSGGNFSYTYNVTAGTLYYIGVRAYSYSTSGSATVYISGTLKPTSVATAQCSEVSGLMYSSTSTYVERVGYGETYTLPEITRSGYTFLGWYYGNQKIESGVWNIAGNVTLQARWERQ